MANSKRKAKEKQKEGKAGAVWKAIAALIAVAVIAAAILIAYYFTNGFNENFKTFYIEFDGERIVSSNTSLLFETGEEYHVDVHYTFDFVTSEMRDYNVQIVANENTDFEYKQDGVPLRWRKVGDLSELFGLKKEASGFTFTVPKDLTVKSALEAIYPASKIEAPDESELKDSHVYTLIVSSYNEKVTYHINCGPTSSAKKYGIDYDYLGSGAARFEGVSEAAAGETVTFSVYLVDSEYPLKITRVVMIPRDWEEDAEEVELGYDEGTYSFTMPASFVTIMIYISPA